MIFLVFEIKQKIDLNAYFELYSIRFSALEISTKWGGGFTYVSSNILRGIYLCCKMGQI